MKKRLDTSLMNWFNRPTNALVQKTRIIIETQPYTDLWYNSTLHQEKFNAPALVLPIQQNFTLTMKMEFNFQKQYDQAGIFIMGDSAVWIKAGVEYRNEVQSSLCATVTYGGFSDWSGWPISSEIRSMYIRVHRWKNEFKVEFSFNGLRYKPLRQFCLPLQDDKIQVGIYACSPQDSSYNATFSEMTIESLIWEEKKYEFESR